MKLKMKVTEKGKSNAIDAKIKADMVKRLDSFFADDSFGFEMFVLAKSDPLLRAFHLDDKPGTSDEYDGASFKARIGNSIKNVIISRFIGFDEKERADIHYDDGTYLADNQKKIYVFKQTDMFKPFEMLSMPEEQVGDFKQKDIDDIKGFLFRFSRGEDVLWAYQHYYGITVSKNKGIRGIFNRFEDNEVFTEFNELLITISSKVDLLIDGEKIITDRIKLLQSHFGFEMYIEAVTKETVKAVEKLDIVENMDKIASYVSRGQNNIYKKRVMRISHSNVNFLTFL